MKEKGIKIFYPSNKNEWRIWLEKNHKTEDAVWLIMHKKGFATHNLTWEEAVDVALCFGWIDSTRKPIDNVKFKQYYSRRKGNSIWSKINKQKIETLIETGQMTEAGLQCVEIAKQNGSWTILDAIENLEIPAEMEQEFSKRPGSRDYFLSLSMSVRKAMLSWIVLAKKTETRQKRIIEIAENAVQKQKPKQF